MRISLFAPALCALAGCGRQPLHVRLAEDVQRPERYVVIFFVDGLDRERMNDLLKEEKLPNIEATFARGGVGVKRAIAGIPAMTYPNTVSIFTGLFPGHHGVMGNQWFDRRNMFWIDYITAMDYMSVNQSFRAPTLYELIPDYFTLSVQCHLNRGATYSLDNALETGPAWFIGLHGPVDQYVASCIEQAGPLATRCGRWPSVITFYFPGVDEVGHVFGPASTNYREAVIEIDRQIGRVTSALERAGLRESACFVLVSDHGHVDTKGFRTVDLKGWLKRARGLKCHDGDIPRQGYPERAAFLKKYDAMIVDGSHRRIMIHLRGSGGWHVPATAAQIHAVVNGEAGHPDATPMTKLEGVEFICTRAGANRVRVLSKRGSVVVERRLAGSMKEYRVVVDQGEDAAGVLGLEGDPAAAEMLTRGWHASRDWLAATAASAFPDFVPQIVEYFDGPCAGDVLVFVSDGWATPAFHPGVHGSCRAADMNTTLYFAGPGLPRGATIPHARLVDVMPTLLDLLGESDRLNHAPPIDGMSLAAELRAAQP